MCCENMACCAPVAKCGRARFCGCASGVCSCSGADITVMLSSGAVSAGIEVFFELYFPHTGSNWITKALLSSASSAVATFLIGMAIYSTECGRPQGEKGGCPFLLGLTISQLIAGGVSFGVGIGLDALTENLIRDHNSGDLVNAVVSPVLTSIARGFFKSASTGVVGFFSRKCCPNSIPQAFEIRPVGEIEGESEQETESQQETEPLLQDPATGGESTSRPSLRINN